MHVVRRVALALAIVAVAAGAVGSLLAWHGGWRVYVVQTGSMTPTIQPGDVVVDAGPRSRVAVGDVVTFRAGANGLVTHRVHGVDAGRIVTQGDANRTPDPWSIARRDVVGSVRVSVPRAGFVLVYLQQPAGVLSLVTLLFALVLAWGLFFPSPPAPASVGSSSRALPATALVLGVGLVATLAAATSVATTRSTGAYFSDSRAGTFGFHLCDPQPSHGSDDNHGHQRCAGATSAR